jgi:hypothetical protein
MLQVKGFVLGEKFLPIVQSFNITFKYKKFKRLKSLWLRFTTEHTEKTQRENVRICKCANARILQVVLFKTISVALCASLCALWAN